MLTHAPRVTLWISDFISENSSAQLISGVLLQQRYDEARRPQRRPFNRRGVRPLRVPQRKIIPEQPTEYSGREGLMNRGVAGTI